MDAPKTMFDFVTSLENLIVTMKQLNRKDLLTDSRLVRDLAAKLPSNLFQTWTKHVLDKKSFSILAVEEFHTWMKPHKDLATVLLAEKCREGSTKEELKFHVSQKEPKNNSEKKLKCFSCDGNHKTTTCDNLKKNGC